MFEVTDTLRDLLRLKLKIIANICWFLSSHLPNVLLIDRLGEVDPQVELGWFLLFLHI